MYRPDADAAIVKFLPNFFLLGAVKCGTTALAHYLHQHPDICIADGKETGFFDSDLFLSKGSAWYSRSFFRHADGSIRLGDATPTYIYSPELVVPRFREVLPGAELKYIVLLRDPVKRAWSHYLHMKRLGEETRAFEVALEKEFHDHCTKERCAYFAGGMYSTYLTKWFAEVGREDMLVLFAEDLNDNRLGIIAQVFEFLGVSKDYVPLDLARKNVSKTARSLTLARVLWNFQLRAIVKSIVPVKMRRRIRYSLNEINSIDSNIQPRMPPSIARDLYGLYEPERNFVDDLFGIGASRRWRFGSESVG